MLAPWKESYDKPRQHIKKQRQHIYDKSPHSQSYVFPAIMCTGKIWTIRKAEHWRIDAFELWCWRRLLRVPWTSRRSNQSILKEINPEYSLRGLMLRLQNFWPPDAKGWLSGKDSDAGNNRRQKQKGMTEDEMVRQHHQLNGHESEQTPEDSEGYGSLGSCSSWVHKESDMT